MTANNVVVLDGAEPRDLERLLQTLLFGSEPQETRFHLLMRRDPTELDKTEKSFLREFFRHLWSRPDLAARLGFYAPTEALTRVYNQRYARFSGAVFTTAATAEEAERLPVLASKSSTRGTVLFVMEWWPLLEGTNGACHTARGVLEWLTVQGYEIDIVANHFGPEGANQSVDWENRVRKMLEPYSVRALEFVQIPDFRFEFDTYEFEECESAIDFLATRVGYLSRIGGLEQQLCERALARVPFSLRERIRTTEYAFAWVNWSTNVPLVERLGLKGLPIICETHDQPEFGEESKTAELLRRTRCTIFVNDAERRPAEKRLPNTTCLTIVRPAPVPDLSLALAGCRTMVDVTAIALPAREHFDTAMDRAAQLPELDLLFVSSNYGPNVDSLNWFFREVYEPYLDSHGIRMIVAGSVGTASALKLPGGPNVFSVGRVERLEPLYAATRVVVLPVISGTGIAIKTVEALSIGKPLIGTPLAFRGLESLLEETNIVANDAADFASKILVLLSSMEARKAAAADVRRLAEKVVHRSAYLEGLTRAMKSVDPSFEPRPMPNVDAPASPLLVEFDEENASFARAALTALAGQEVPAEIAQVVLAAARDSERWTLFRQMFDALCDSRALIRQVGADPSLNLLSPVRLSFEGMICDLREAACPAS